MIAVAHCGHRTRLSAEESGTLISTEQCEHFTRMDQTFVNDRIALLDSIIEDAVNESGVASYADVYNAFNDHEECTGDPRHYLVDRSNGNVVCYSDSQDINGVDPIQGVKGSPATD